MAPKTARHGVKGGRRPQGTEVVERAQQVGHIQEVGAQAVAGAPDGVDPLEGLVRRPDRWQVLAMSDGSRRQATVVRAAS